MALILLVLVLTHPMSETREQSKSYWCYARVRNQSQGLLAYAVDTDGRFPPRRVWMDATAPYRRDPSEKDMGSFRCPNAPKGGYGYAFNAALLGATVPLSPETAPLTYDSVNLSRNASDRFLSLPRPGRHEGRNAIGYADGHARRVEMGEAR